MRLIDADALISDLEEWKKNPNNDDSAVDLVNHFIGIIRATPSAVCDDCIWHVCNYNKVDWDALPSADAEPMTEEVREALMRLSMCAREDCVICKYKDKCNFDFQYEESTRNMNTILDSLMRSKCEVDAEWIPCSERLPKAEDMYQPPEQRYLCQLEAYGVRKFCVLARLKGAVSPFWDWYGVAFHDADVIAWMPLPKPYREDGET